MTDKGATKACRENVVLALDGLPTLGVPGIDEVAGVIAYNEFTNNVEKLKASPWGTKAGEWLEEDELEMGNWLVHKHHLPSMPRTALEEAVDDDELARNPFRVFTSMLATRDRRFFHPDLRDRVEAFVAQRQLFDPALIDIARRVATDGECPAADADDFVQRAVEAFSLSRAPIDRAWYDELSAVSAVAADIAGVDRTHINHLTPRVLDIDDLYARMSARGIAMIDAIQGPPRRTPAVLLRQTSFRALSEPRRFAEPDGSVHDGTLRVRFGEVEARGVALTCKGRERYDAAMAQPDRDATWGDHFPDTDAEMASQGLAYYRHGDPAKPVVYEDFLPASAAGIFRSNLDSEARKADGDSGDYSWQWMAGEIGTELFDPYALYEKAAS